MSRSASHVSTPVDKNGHDHRKSRSGLAGISHGCVKTAVFHPQRPDLPNWTDCNCRNMNRMSFYPSVHSAPDVLFLDALHFPKPPSLHWTCAMMSKNQLPTIFHQIPRIICVRAVYLCPPCIQHPLHNGSTARVASVVSFSWECTLRNLAGGMELDAH